MPMFSAQTLRRLWPHASQALVDGIAASAPAVFAKYGMTSDLVIAHAMAQFSHECGAGLEMVENIHYTAKRACQVWPSRFRSEDECYRKVGSYVGDPQFAVKLIDSVYGNRMGNRPGTHDGSTFIGRGLSQVTGREGYEKLGAKVGLDLIAHPEMIVDPRYALECGVADFVLCGCLQWAEHDNVEKVTERLNGGHIGLSERKAWLARWKTALEAEPRAAKPAPTPVPSPAPEAPKPTSATTKVAVPGGIVVAGGEAARQAHQAGMRPAWIVAIALAAIVVAAITFVLLHNRGK